jgi:stage II sporulation protein R
MLKKTITNNIKLLRAALTLGLVATVILQSTVLAQQCHGIRDQVFRLHILANSDTECDQQLKIKVRDRILKEGAHLLKGAKNKEDAILLTQNNLDALTAIAQKEINQNGYQYSVTCRVAQTYFETRTYDNAVTLPAGNYTALQVIIGEGKGKNWWCVMFPNLCIPAASEVETTPHAMDEVLTEGETHLVENGNRYQIKFKTVEWVQSLLNQCREWF